MLQIWGKLGVWGGNEDMGDVGNMGKQGMLRVCGT